MKKEAQDIRNLFEVYRTLSGMVDYICQFALYGPLFHLGPKFGKSVHNGFCIEKKR